MLAIYRALVGKNQVSFLNSTLETCLRTSFRVCCQTQVRCTFGCAQRFTASKQTSSPWGDMSGVLDAGTFRMSAMKRIHNTWYTMWYALQINLHGPTYIYTVYMFFFRWLHQFMICWRLIGSLPYEYWASSIQLFPEIGDTSRLHICLPKKKIRTSAR